MSTADVPDLNPPWWAPKIVALLYSVGVTMSVVFSFGGELVVFTTPAGVMAGVVVYWAFYGLFLDEE